MYTNDLNNAYLYESERRNDERRAAIETQLLAKLSRKSRGGIPSPVTIAGILMALIVLLRAL